MKFAEISRVAAAYYSAHGDKAEAEAAQKAVKAEAEGNAEEAANWQSIRLAIKEMRGAHQG